MPCAKRHAEGSDLEDIDEGALAPPLVQSTRWRTWGPRLEACEASVDSKSG